MSVEMCLLDIYSLGTNTTDKLFWESMREIVTLTFEMTKINEQTLTKQLTQFIKNDATTPLTALVIQGPA